MYTTIRILLNLKRLYWTVKWKSLPNAKKSSAVILTPNQRAALCQGVLKVKPIENTNNYLWRKGILYFNEPLLEVFDKLQEATGGIIFGTALRYATIGCFT